MIRDREADVILPPYRRASAHPEQSLTEAEVTPAVVAAWHPEMVSKLRLFERGMFRHSFTASEIGKACNMSGRKCQRILNGHIEARMNDKIVIATYLQMTIEELDREIAARRPIAQEWMRRRKNRAEPTREELLLHLKALERLNAARSR